MVTGMAFQLYRERNKAPFPPCPRKVRRRNLQPVTRFLRDASGDNDERQPLVPDSTPHCYGAENTKSQDESASA